MNFSPTALSQIGFAFAVTRSVGNLERDEFVGEVYDLGLPTHTDPNEIASLLRARSNGPKIVFTTYQSSNKLAAAARKARINFDLAILDEAHKTVGVHSKKFATLLSDKKIKIRRRLFMTATERVFRGDNDEVLSMDSEKDYGARFLQLSFKEAIKQRIISDYKILTMTVSDSRIRELVDENRILNLIHAIWTRLRRSPLPPELLSSGFTRDTRLHTQFHFIGASVRQTVFENSKTLSIDCMI